MAKGTNGTNGKTSTLEVPVPAPPAAVEVLVSEREAAWASLALRAQALEARRLGNKAQAARLGLEAQAAALLRREARAGFGFAAVSSVAEAAKKGAAAAAAALSSSI